uniref:Cilia- and flagella-associated protein 157 n=1 Tax=Globisporangium ultimum (strain ATCC 200006 / CBS 805.95 / DAOM BR144) TaxID=431595 RepID=K3W5K9_GLOUD
MASLNALDFFGKDDPEGIEKFKTVAFRALLDQRTDEELRQTKLENERLLRENAVLSKQLQDLQVSFDTNVGDRERVLAFKSKRIEELNIKLKECEAINVSLLQTINNGSAGGGTGSRAAMVALTNGGKPLFHAVETCKEQEFKKMLDDKRLQCDQLQQQILANEALVQKMRVYQGQKEEIEAQIQQLRDKIVAITAEKDEEVHFLERKLVFEHDRLRKEKEIEIRACQDAMEKQMRAQLDVTTQRTIEENERVQLELRYQSSQLEKLVKRLDHLMVENKQLQQEKCIFEDMNGTLSKKVKFYEQLFTKMQQKDQLKSKHMERMSPAPEETRFHTPRKPPLPSIGSPRSPSTMSAFGMSPPHSPRLSRQQEDGPGFYSDEGDYNPDGEDQLNLVSEALEVHLQHREFTKKQVDAVLRQRRVSITKGSSWATYRW